MKPLWVFALCYAWATVLIVGLWHTPLWVRVTVQPAAALVGSFGIGYTASRRARLRRCRHTMASVSEWTASDGTPMVTIYCPGCGWRDQGPVMQ